MEDTKSRLSATVRKNFVRSTLRHAAILRNNLPIEVNGLRDGITLSWKDRDTHHALLSCQIRQWVESQANKVPAVTISFEYRRLKLAGGKPNSNCERFPIVGINSECGVNERSKANHDDADSNFPMYWPSHNQSLAQDFRLT